ncbi:MAG: phosphoenolpyruvate--protein phosphotransferase [Deferribacterota bacterium]|nr:phosphoenolpyruvate--protein phosphotransferase [Deferribacterota bacterium]
MIKFTGTPSSDGIAIGTVYLIERELFRLPRYRIEKKDVENEKARLYEAIERSKEYFRKIKISSKNVITAEHAYIFDAYLMFLNDKKFINEIVNYIEKRLINAEFAVSLVVNKILKSFRDIKDEYFKERKYDFEHIAIRLINEMAGKNSDNLYGIGGNNIVVSNDISPSDAILLIKKNIKGLVLEKGSKTAHTSILARSIGIPAVVGVNSICDYVDNDDFAIIDGFTGEIIINPDDETLKRYREREERYKLYIDELNKLEDATVKTADGVDVNIFINVEINEEIKLSNRYNIKGVGLYRTEFMYLANSNISEDEQFKIFKEAILLNGDKQITIRTYDLGGDKLNREKPYDKEANPALGLRAIRYSLKNRDFFKKQLRAIYRASYYGDVKIMIPMVSGIEEIRETKRIIDEVKNELRLENKPYNDIPLGVMVEIPSLALIANLVAKEVDFFSVGSNDLIQYTLGIDRGNENVSYLYRPTHISVLMLLERILKAANKNNIEVTVCGDIASEPKYIAVLLGIGYRNLSVPPAAILRTKMIIRRLYVNQCKKLLSRLKTRITAEESELELEKFIEKNVSGIYFH